MAPDSLMGNKAKRLNIYIGESDRWRGKVLYMALVEKLRAANLAGVTVVRGVAGFGAHSLVHTASILRLSLDLPLIIQVIDTQEKIQHALKLIAPMVVEGLITIEDVEVIKYTHRYLSPLPTDKAVSKIMTRTVVTLTDTMPVATAWEKMLAYQLKGLPVLNSKGQVVGMLTDQDLLSRAGLEQHLSIAERLDEATLASEFQNLKESPLKVADVMTTPIITVNANDPLGVAVTLMADHGIKRLPVLDQAGKLVGVLARVDVLSQVIGEETRVRFTSAPPGAARILGDVMLPDVPAVHEDASLAQVIVAFLEASTRRLIVTDLEGCPLGLISDADVVMRVQPEARRGVLQALRGKQTSLDSAVTAAKLMSRQTLNMAPDTLLTEAAHAMLTHNRKWIVVVDAQGRAVGLVDRQILFKAMMHQP